MSNETPLGGNEKMPPAAEPEAQGRQLPTESSPQSSAKTSNESGKNPEPDYSASIDFLRRFHPNRNWVLTAITLDKKSLPTATFTEAQSAECRAWLQRYGPEHNLYYSVGEVPRAVTKKVERESIQRVWWLHADFDPRVGEDLAAEQTRILKLFRQPPNLPPPTVIVFSGGGYQAFWQLREPIVTDCNLEAADDAARYNKRIEWLLGSDSVRDVSRIMRLPGTLNRPDAKKLAKGRKLARAEVVEWRSERIYDIGQFEKAPEETDAPQRAKAQVSTDVKRIASVDELPAAVSGKAKVVICQGFDPDEPNKFHGRSEWLYFACCEMVRAGCSDDQIYSVITDPGFGISASVLDKGSMVHRYALRQIERARAEATVPELAELNQKHFVVSNWGGKCRVAQEVYDDFLRRARLTRQSFEDFRNRYMNRQIQIGVKTDKTGAELPIMKPLGNWWLEQPHRRNYERIVFAPGTNVPDDVYNLWQGFGCIARAGDCSLLLQHLRENICGGNDKTYEYLMGWMARAVQNPGEPGQVAVVLRGRQGTGKSFFVKMFGSLFGRHYLRIADMKHLVGSFNSHLRDVVVLFADEAFYAGDKKSRGLLKSLVTDETLQIEAKGYDAELARNCVHLMMASNDKWVVPAEFDDRRFCVLDVGVGHACDSGYFRAIAQQMDNGGREALLHLLQTHDLSEFEVRNRPVTAGLQDQKVLSIDAGTEWLLVLLEDGVLPSATKDRPNCAFSNDIEPYTVGLFSDARKRVPKLRTESDHALGSVLRDWGAKPWKNGRRGWAFPALSELRANWEKRYGPREWSGGSQAEWRAMEEAASAF